MKITKHNENTTVYIRIAESVTIKQIGEIYIRLIEAVQDTPAAIRMDLCGISECDISFIQVLISYKKLLDQKDVFLIFEPLRADNPFITCMQLCGIHPEYLFNLEEEKYGL